MLSRWVRAERQLAGRAATTAGVSAPWLSPAAPSGGAPSFVAAMSPAHGLCTASCRLAPFTLRSPPPPISPSTKTAALVHTNPNPLRTTGRRAQKEERLGGAQQDTLAALRLPVRDSGGRKEGGGDPSSATALNSPRSMGPVIFLGAGAGARWRGKEGCGGSATVWGAMPCTPRLLRAGTRQCLALSRKDRGLLQNPFEGRDRQPLPLPHGSALQEPRARLLATWTSGVGERGVRSGNGWLAARGRTS